ncbi:hypothetical protein ACE12W_004734, partial [Salmonella enterica subsp. enterica serovar Braenderup]
SKIIGSLISLSDPPHSRVDLTKKEEQKKKLQQIFFVQSVVQVSGMGGAIFCFVPDGFYNG